jgi:hypothetical protein
MATSKGRKRPAPVAEALAETPTKRATPACARGTKGRIRSDAGVERCIELMTSGAWVRGRSGKVVADEFGVSPETVKEWATSASRVIRLAVDGDTEDIRARMLATLDHVVSEAMSKQGAATTRSGKDVEVTFFPAPDLKAAVSAVAEQAKLLGLVEQKHKVDVTVQAFASLDDGAMLERVRAQMAELRSLEARLEAKLGVVTVPALPAKKESGR